jgi:hypothetical protein
MILRHGYNPAELNHLTDDVLPALLDRLSAGDSGTRTE